eukprot:GHRR01028408.1.p1 GENE.GHRR01028408.1~~GHRR01028408.1.p1  ORF type:complete len:124 (-),score=31.82 GHRR01028408.1:452-823(-)
MPCCCFHQQHHLVTALISIFLLHTSQDILSLSLLSAAFQLYWSAAVRDPMDYTGPAVSAFQKAMRGKAKQLQDHICKEMNLLNLERCRCIPKDTPGADWRVLLEIVNNDPSKELYNVSVEWQG